MCPLSWLSGKGGTYQLRQLFCVRRGGSMGLWRDLGTDDRFRRNVLHGFDGIRLVLGTDNRF